jgi:hypothetical protein
VLSEPVASNTVVSVLVDGVTTSVMRVSESPSPLAIRPALAAPFALAKNFGVPSGENDSPNPIGIASDASTS